MDYPTELLDYELRRNGVVVGRIRLGVPTDVLQPGTLLGMLEPTAEFDDIHQMMQSRARTIEGEPVLQHDVPGAPSPVVHHGVRGGRAGPFEFPGISADQVLTLHRSNGQLVETESLIITRVEDEATVTALREACADHALEPSPWGCMALLRTPDP